jgi:3'-5' exoribonuclease
MGPRPPGDKGPQARPAAGGKNLTHNPFAALAAKLEGGAPPDAPAAGEPAPEPPAPAAEAMPPDPSTPGAAEVHAPEGAPEPSGPAGESAPAEAGPSPAEGENR